MTRTLLTLFVASTLTAGCLDDSLDDATDDFGDDDIDYAELDPDYENPDVGEPVVGEAAALSYGLEPIKLPCFHAPEPTLHKGYATDSKIKLQIRFDCPNVDGWELWRSAPTGSYLPFAFKVATRTGGGGYFYDSGLKAGQKYCYQAIGRNRYGTAKSELLCITTMPRFAEPATPSDLEVEVVGSEWRLTWTDNADNETDFVVRRTNGDPVIVGAVVSDNPRQVGGTFSFSENRSGLYQDTEFCYEVYAHNYWGNSAGEAAACGWTPPTKPSTPSVSLDPSGTDSLDVTIYDSGNRADRARIRLFDSGGWLGSEYVDLPGTTTTVELDGLSAGHEYCVEVRTVNEPEDPSTGYGSIWSNDSDRVCASTDGAALYPKDLFLKISETPSGLAQFATSYDPGPGPTARIKSLLFPEKTNPTGITMKLLKPGYDFDKCATDADATIRLAPDESLTEAELDTLFGTARTPRWYFIACAEVAGDHLESGTSTSQLHVKIKYQRD